jgi:hypothetical protein
MKKMKQAPPEPTPGIETFGGDYHKFESTFQPRTGPAVAIEATKRKRPLPTQGKRKDSRVQGREIGAAIDLSSPGPDNGR